MGGSSTKLAATNKPSSAPQFIPISESEIAKFRISSVVLVNAFASRICSLALEQNALKDDYGSVILAMRLAAELIVNEPIPRQTEGLFGKIVDAWRRHELIIPGCDITIRMQDASAVPSGKPSPLLQQSLFQSADPDSKQGQVSVDVSALSSEPIGHASRNP